MLTLLLEVVNCTIEEKGDKKGKKEAIGRYTNKKVETE
jgi:hypothetical protein